MVITVLRFSAGGASVDMGQSARIATGKTEERDNGLARKSLQESSIFLKFLDETNGLK